MAKTNRLPWEPSNTERFADQYMAGESNEKLARIFNSSYNKVKHFVARGVRTGLFPKRGTFVPTQEAVVEGLDQVALGVLKRLKSSQTAVDLIALSNEFDLAPKKIQDTIDMLSGQGYLVDIEFGHVKFTYPLAGTRSKRHAEYLDNKRTIKFGIASDAHLCSKYARLDLLNTFFDICVQEGVKTVYDCGNAIDGEARFNKQDLMVHGLGNQVEYWAENWPQREGIVTEFICGDDHEGWYCFEAGTEILTRDRGWIDFQQVLYTDYVATKTVQGRFEWQLPIRIIQKPYKGNLIRLKHRSIDIAVTPEHRFEVEKKSSMHGVSETCIVTAQEIFDEFKPRTIGIPRTTKTWVGVLPEPFSIPVQANRYLSYPGRWVPKEIDAIKLAQLYAWFVTEGSIEGNQITIAQDKEVNPDKHNKIVQILKDCGAVPRVYDTCVQVASPNMAAWLLKNCGKGWANKQLPRWVLDLPSYALAMVFETLIAGDGHNRGKGAGWKFYSGSPWLIAQMSEICQKLGLTCSYAPGKGCVNMHIGEVYDDAFLFEKPTLEAYDGLVFCVSVPNERIFVRHNGKTLWSLNCQREGINIGWYMEQVAKKKGRTDLKYLGYMEHDIELTTPEGGKTVIRLQHPGGGSAYAVSYQPQKIIESLAGGEKPHILLLGHYHKAGSFFLRSVHTVLTGCFQAQSPFMRKKRLAAHLGGYICEFTQAPDGSVLRWKPMFIPFYDESNYDDKWEYRMEG